MFKLVVPLIFLLLADGQGKDEAQPAQPAPPTGNGLFKSPAPPETAEAKKRHADEAEGKPVSRRAPRPERVDREAPAGEAGFEGAREPGRDKGRERRGGESAERREIAAVSRRGGANPAERTGSDSERVVNPSAGLSAGAMRDELGQHASTQKASTEREKLEALSLDLARARAALREETVRLEGLMDKARQAGVLKPGGNGAANPASNGGGEGGGPATMPIGDPLAPSAYFRPAPPPPNFAVQVEVVSKAIKSMKPEQAAGVIGHLERGLAAEVLQRMRAADAGAILGFLRPEIAAALASEIVSRPPIRGKDADKEKL